MTARLAPAIWRRSAPGQVGRWLSALLLAGIGSVSTQAGTPSDSEPVAPADTVEPDAAAKWSGSVSVYGYVVPDDRDYLQPTVTLDRDWLHLEARYDYEAADTGSAWLGYNWGGDGKLSWELTPMLGGVFGELTGIAPGYRASLGWWKLELYSEGEYVIDPGETSNSFFYNWAELALAPADWFRFGVVTQRTQLYESEHEIQRGLLVGLGYKQIELTTYVFNPDDREPLVVVGLAVSL